MGVLLLTVPALPAVFEEVKFLLTKNQTAAEVRIDDRFQIVIPKIGARARVIAGVDPFSESEYLSALKQGVAQARGTAKPGERGTVFLFAHSTDSIWNIKNYNAVFYLLNKLETGDSVWIDYRGKRFAYRVENKEVVSPTEERYLRIIAGQDQEGEELVLQTCWPPGTTWKRLLVRAKRV